jgi:microcystin-dependent protein
MTDPFLAEIRVAAFGFPPVGWAQCDGQLLPIAQNTALFSLLGTYYGGDGKSTFALPDLRNALSVHQGQGPGLSDYYLGQQGGEETVTLINSEMPGHTHQAMASIDDAQFQAPAPDRELATTSPGYLYQSNDSSSLAPMSPQTLTTAGASVPHYNRQPSLVVSFIIAMQGIYPARP